MGQVPQTHERSTATTCRTIAAKSPPRLQFAGPDRHDGGLRGLSRIDRREQTADVRRGPISAGMRSVHELTACTHRETAMRRTGTIKAIAVLLTLAGGIQAPFTTWGQVPKLELPRASEGPAPGPLPKLERIAPGALTPKEIYHKLLPSTCWVVHEERVGSSSGLSWGTGWVVDARRRLIVTNHHVVDGVDVVRVGFPIMKDGRVVNDPRFYFNGVDLITGTVIDRSPQCDLALV